VIKRRLYERTGVKEYWIVDPDLESIKIYRPGEDGRYLRAAELSTEARDVLTTELLRDFSMPLTSVFELP
jgi:Uma2 family endonuclease